MRCAAAATNYIFSVLSASRCAHLFLRLGPPCSASPLARAVRRGHSTVLQSAIVTKKSLIKSYSSEGCLIFQINIQVGNQMFVQRFTNKKAINNNELLRGMEKEGS